ncbi:MAG: ARPP-1 family domain-containing protein [Microthrixaceae bacterium]
MSPNPASTPTPALEHASIGAPITRLGVSLFPLYLHQPPGPRITSTGGGGVHVEEAQDEEVPTLVATNHAPEPLLLVEGETLAGGLQQRTLNVSVLIGPGTTVEVPVTCVEAGRWGGSREFTGSTGQTSRRVRRAKTAGVRGNLRSRGEKLSNQSAVWDSVDHELERLRAPSPTRNFADAEAAITRDDKAAAALTDLAGRGPLPAQCGVVISHGSRVVAAELFADHDLLEEQWEPTVRAALLDAPVKARGRPSASRALRFVRRMAKAPSLEADGVDLGRERHIESPRLVGQALSWEQRLVHASAFALAA